MPSFRALLVSLLAVTPVLAQGPLVAPDKPFEVKE